MTLLALENLDVFYGDMQATFGVGLHVEEGEAVALIGANGAGKSTLLRAMIGLTPARRGTVTFAGENITRQRCDLVARRGIAIVPEGRRLFASLSVEENLLMGAARASPGPWTPSSTCSPPCAIFVITMPPSFRAGSSRWWPSAGPC